MWTDQKLVGLFLLPLFLRFGETSAGRTIISQEATFTVGSERNGKSVGRAFDADSDTYNRERRMLIPCFDGFYGNAIEVLRDWDAPEHARVVDLGAGTGLFSAMVAEALPDATLRLLDLSPDMLAQAKARFAGTANERIETRVFDLASDDLEGPWDLVISALAIHHLSDEEKKGLFRRIHDALAPGGLFVNAEQILGSTPEIDERYVRRWHDAIRAAGASDESVARAEARMTFDQSSTICDQLDWMRNAGFEQVDCTFQAWRFAVLVGWKSTTDEVTDV
jgi:tRNA (cmo5U34)-methyltransferase